MPQDEFCENVNDNDDDSDWTNETRVTYEHPEIPIEPNMPLVEPEAPNEVADETLINEPENPDLHENAEVESESNSEYETADSRSASDSDTTFVVPPAVPVRLTKQQREYQELLAERAAAQARRDEQAGARAERLQGRKRDSGEADPLTSTD